MEISELRNEPEMKDLIEMLNNIWPSRKEGSAELKNKLSSVWTRKKENVGIHQEDRIWIMGVPARSSRIGRKSWALHVFDERHKYARNRAASNRMTSKPVLRPLCWNREVPPTHTRMQKAVNQKLTIGIQWEIITSFSPKATEPTDQWHDIKNLTKMREKSRYS